MSTMIIEKDCLFCDLKFLADSRELNRGNAKFCSRSCSSFYQNKDKHNHNCKKCNNIIPFEKRLNKFCSRSCANSRTKTEEVKLTQSIAAKSSKKVLNASIKRRGENYLLNTNCKNCKVYLDTSKKHKFCGDNCRKEFRQKGKNKLGIYRNECRFKFSLKDYPTKFDFSLIEKYGWYSPTNKNNNLEGVSRDHMYSVKEGFINNIDPQIIAHPANCNLITQRENSIKRSKSTLTIEELEKRIKEW